jgi:hypothetical protein
MTDHFHLRLSNPDDPNSVKKKYCMHCSESYSKLVSTSILKNHYEKFHKSQPSITESSSRMQKLVNDQQLPDALARIFASLNWPLHHVASKSFAELFRLVRQSSVAPPHRKKLRASTITLSNVYRQR